MGDFCWPIQKEKDMNYGKVFKLEIEATSEGMSEKTLSSYTSCMIRGNSKEIHRLMMLLQPDIYYKHVNCINQRYNTFKTEYHLIYINNEGVHFFFKYS